MFRSRLIVSASIIAMSSLVACTINTANQPSESAGGRSNASTANKGVGGADATDWSSGGADDEESTGGTSNTFTYATGGKLGTGGTASLSCVLGGEITANTTWEPNAGCPDGYSVSRTVTVTGAGTKLTIKPGTKLKFASGTKLEVQASASLVAVGATDSPIVFTGWQRLAGAWGGILIQSGAVENEIAHAIVEYGGQQDVLSAGVVVWYDTQPAWLKLSDVKLQDSARFGITLSDKITLAQFENNTITRNAQGAVRVFASSVHQLRGAGNSLVDNGNGNIVRIETSMANSVEGADVTWPNLAPAIYRVTDMAAQGGDQVYVKGHLTIEPGTIIEFVGGGGIDVKDGTSGLSAIGTPAAPIVFRGVSGSGWTGIGFCESGWQGNAIEEVQILNASGPTYSEYYCGGWSTAPDASVLVGHNFSTKASNLRVKNVKFSGPSAGQADLQVKSPSALTVEGVNTGTGANGELLVSRI